MKKLLLIAAASATILSSTLTFAEGMEDNQWYLKANAGATIFNKERDKITGIKMKSNTAFTGEIGAGYYIMENLRTDLTLGTVASAKLKKSAAANNGIYAGSNINVSHKPTVVDLLLNGYVDFIDVGMFKVFGGAGIGAALLKEKVSYGGQAIANNATLAAGTVNASTKNTYNFAYKLAVGTSFEVAEGVKAELVYNWLSLGKSKAKNVQVQGNTVKIGGVRYQGHNLMAGLRFDI